ncbi:MAG: GGDEF domain-containing protein [Syntrophobacteraceae bacterium]
MSLNASDVGLEKLSLTVIDVLKDLSAAKSPLTADALFKSLQKRKDLTELFSKSFNIGPKGNGRKTPTNDGLPALQDENRRLREQEVKLRQQISSMEGDGSSRVGFSKRAILTLITLAQNETNQSLSPALDSLRNVVLNDARIDEQNLCLQNLKDLILREDPRSSGQPVQGIHSGASRELEVAASALASQVAGTPSLYVPKVQSAFLSILTQLEPVSQQLNHQVYSELRTRLAQCQDMDTLVSLGEDVVGFVKNYVGKLIQQNDQVAVFAKELGKNLTEMEEQLLFSLNINQEGHEANAEFSNTLQGEVEDIQGSFLADRSIQDIQKFVFTKLKAIRKAIEDKNAQDEVRFHQAQGSMDDLKKNLLTMTAEINRVQERARTLEREVLLDGLTGIHNRRAYEQRIHEEFARYCRYGMTYSLVLFDVDHFKKLNDQFGHRAGDKCLREIINRVKSCTRNTDFIARYGGEEFVILLTGTNKEGAYVVAEKVRRVIAKTRFSFQEKTLPVTISLGVSEISASDNDVDSIFSRADSAMYRAKAEGRNLVCVD